MKYTYIKPAIITLNLNREICTDIPISDKTTPEESEANTGFFENESDASTAKNVDPWGEE